MMNGTLTKIGKTQSKLQKFSEGHAVTGVFRRLPKVGSNFCMAPTEGPWKFGYFITTTVTRVVRRPKRDGSSVVRFTTGNSLYELVYRR